MKIKAKGMAKRDYLALVHTRRANRSLVRMLQCEQLAAVAYSKQQRGSYIFLGNRARASALASYAVVARSGSDAR